MCLPGTSTARSEDFSKVFPSALIFTEFVYPQTNVTLVILKTNLFFFMVETMAVWLNSNTTEDGRGRKASHSVKWKDKNKLLCNCGSLNLLNLLFSDGYDQLDLTCLVIFQVKNQNMRDLDSPAPLHVNDAKVICNLPPYQRKNLRLSSMNSQLSCMIKVGRLLSTQ